MDVAGAVGRSARETFNGIVHRVYHPEHGFIETIGSFLGGGRWNRKEEYGALYTSLSRETAILETQRTAEKRHLKPSDLGPRDLVAIEVTLEHVLNLTRPEFYNDLGRSQDEVLGDDEACLQACLQIADEARRHRFDALLVPSATRVGSNLVIFMDQLAPGWKFEETNREKDIDLDR